MQDAQGPAAGAPPAGTPVEQFRTLVDAAVDAIHPIAEMETWSHDHSIFDKLQHPGAHGRDTDSFGQHIDEAAGFKTLADELTTFRTGLDQISFPNQLHDRVTKLRAHTDELIGVARVESTSGGLVPVDTSRRDRRHFLKAVNAWQDSVAGVADHLGL